MGADSDDADDCDSRAVWLENEAALNGWDGYILCPFKFFRFNAENRRIEGR